MNETPHAPLRAFSQRATPDKSHVAPPPARLPRSASFSSAPVAQQCTTGLPCTTSQPPPRDAMSSAAMKQQQQQQKRKRAAGGEQPAGKRPKPSSGPKRGPNGAPAPKPPPKLLTKWVDPAAASRRTRSCMPAAPRPVRASQQHPHFLPNPQARAEGGGQEQEAQVQEELCHHPGARVCSQPPGQQGQCVRGTAALVLQSAQR